ncbi:MAG: FHA domain-containing protein [Coprococcus sp.]|nr:FHA domain-containing protein [Coprococcus sp.]
MDNNSAKLKFISGEYKGSEIEVQPFTELIFGRNPDISNFVFSHNSVSRKHCVIQYNPNDRRFRVTDYSSSGTFINDSRKMTRGTSEYLNSGECIKLGYSDNIVKFIAPEKIVVSQENSNSRPVGDADDKITQKIPLGNSRGSSIYSGFQLGNNQQSQMISNNGSFNPQIQGQSISFAQHQKKESKVLGIIAMIFSICAFAVAAVYLFIALSEYEHFQVKCLILIDGSPILLVALLDIVCIVLGVAQNFSSSNKNKTVKTMATIAIILSCLSLLVIGFMWISAASCTKAQLYEYGLEQASEQIDDILNDFFR